MKLKLKTEYQNTSISFRGTTYLLKETPENMYIHFYNGGFQNYFEIVKPKKIEVKKEEE